MKCPHCLVEINPNFKEIILGDDKEFRWGVSFMVCPNEKCHEMIIELSSYKTSSYGNIIPGSNDVHLVWPFTSLRPPVPKEVDKDFANDYSEACIILNLSPKASAALSRRCLQHILREKAGVKKSDLSKEIQEVIDRGTLPSHLSGSIDAIRNIGNFAAHPIKSTSSGEIVEVETGEAEWLLDVLESLFDFYFVQPAIIKSKRDALNKKLADAGKPEIK